MRRKRDFLVVIEVQEAWQEAICMMCVAGKHLFWYGFRLFSRFGVRCFCFALTDYFETSVRVSDRVYFFVTMPVNTSPNIYER